MVRQDRVGFQYWSMPLYDFCSLNSPTNFKYANNGTTLQSLDKSSTDLSFVLYPTLSPNLHTEWACCKSLKILWFIKRITTEFKLASSLKALYCSLVRPILEYGSVISNFNTAHNAVMLERVQGKFIKYASYVLVFNVLHIIIYLYSNISNLIQ